MESPPPGRDDGKVGRALLFRAQKLPCRKGKRKDRMAGRGEIG